MLIKISIPSYRKIEADNDKSYTVSVNCQFEELGLCEHKKLRSTVFGFVLFRSRSTDLMKPDY